MWQSERTSTQLLQEIPRTLSQHPRFHLSSSPPFRLWNPAFSPILTSDPSLLAPQIIQVSAMVSASWLNPLCIIQTHADNIQDTLTLKGDMKHSLPPLLLDLLTDTTSRGSQGPACVCV